MRWREWTLAIAVASLGFGADAQETSLRKVASRAGMLIGTAVRPAHLSEPAYAATLAREFNMVEPEDALKWEVVHPRPEVFDFSQADEVVDFAVRHGMKVRGHTLVWHQQNPEWLKEGNYSAVALSEILERHIKTVVGHYRGKIFAWDVVNEAFDELRPGQLRSTVWNDQPGIARASKGSSYIELCFRWAREADPEALLFYNEAEAEVVNAKSDAIYFMMRDFRQRGVPIDGIGMQMHIVNLQADTDSISANIKRFTDIGLQVQITEMDVALPVDSQGHAPALALRRQADVYSQIAAACLAHPGCTAIQTWGFTDEYSWIGSHSKKRQGAALPFDENYHSKPAYAALRKALKSATRQSLVVR